MGKTKGRRWVWVAIASTACLLVGTATALLLPAVRASREAARRSVVSNSLHQLGASMHNYHDATQTFPSPRYTNDGAQYASSDDKLRLELENRLNREMKNGMRRYAEPAAAGHVHSVEGPIGPSVLPIVNNPYPIGQDTEGPFRQPLMQGSGVQYNRIAGPGTIPSRPGYVAQQNQPRALAFSPDGKIVTGTVNVTGDISSPGSVQLPVDSLEILETHAFHDRRTEDQDTVANAEAADETRSAVPLLMRGVPLNRRSAERLARALEVLRKYNIESGQGPAEGGDKYVRLVENPFQAVKDHPLSTFSIDVDTASYANVRRFLLQENQLPPPDAVRIEELVNYFDYDYSPPTSDVPFASHIEVAECPWAPEHRLVRIALKGREIQTNQRPASNLVFLLDVSGSMDQPDKLPLLQAGMKLLAGQLSENDRVAIVVYAGSEGLVLPSTVGDQRATILDAIDRLNAGGSTNGGAGIELAYKVARENFIKEGVNRVILCTDGDFNVGTTSTGALERMVEEKAKSGVFLSVLGFGRGNLNDAMMETISNKGNGNYAYIDGITEARKVLVEQMGGTLITIAKDVKIQVEFNPTQAEAYRLIGYENRMLAAEDFNDDKKDAGEIGAGHTVTALYEVVPAGGKVDLPGVDPLKYQTEPKKTRNKERAGELLTLKLRYKQPDGDKSDLLEFPVTDGGEAFSKASPDFQFAAAVASFGMLLRGSQYQGMSSYDAVLEIAQSAKGADKYGYRAEFVQVVERAKPLGEERAALIEEARKVLEAAEQSVEHDQ